MTPEIIAAKPFVELLAPYVAVIVPPIVTFIVGWGAVKFQQLTHIHLQASAVASLKSAAATQAGMLVAAAEDNLADRTFTTSSAEVAAAAQEIAAVLPGAVAFSGATPEALQKFVLGEIGKMQAGQAPVPAPAK